MGTFEYFQGWNSTTSLKKCSTHLMVNKHFPNVCAAITWAPEQVACRGCSVSIFGDIQKLPQYGSGQPALGDSDWTGELDKMSSVGAFPHHSVILLYPMRISFVASCCITLTSEKSGSAFSVPFPSGNSRPAVRCLTNLLFCEGSADQVLSACPCTSCSPLNHPGGLPLA